MCLSITDEQPPWRHVLLLEHFFGEIVKHEKEICDGAVFNAPHPILFVHLPRGTLEQCLLDSDRRRLEKVLASKLLLVLSISDAEANVYKSGGSTRLLSLISSQNACQSNFPLFLPAERRCSLMGLEEKILVSVLQDTVQADLRCVNRRLNFVRGRHGSPNC